MHADTLVILALEGGVGRLHFYANPLLPTMRGPVPVRLAAMPANMVLHAPYLPTAAGDDPGRPLNYSAVPSLAAQAASTGVTVVWVCGSMGAFWRRQGALTKGAKHPWRPGSGGRGQYWPAGRGGGARATSRCAALSRVRGHGA